MSAPARRHRISEPKVVLLAAGVVVIGLLCVVAIADTGAAWLVVLTVLAMALVALAIVLDLRAVIGDSGDDEVIAAPPGRAVVICTASMTADQVLEALDAEHADHRSVMFVAPEGLGTAGLMV